MCIISLSALLRFVHFDCFSRYGTPYSGSSLLTLRSSFKEPTKYSGRVHKITNLFNVSYLRLESVEESRQVKHHITSGPYGHRKSLVGNVGGRTRK